MIQWVLIHAFAAYDSRVTSNALKMSQFVYVIRLIFKKNEKIIQCYLEELILSEANAVFYDHNVK